MTTMRCSACRDADAKTIKSAFRRLARRYHPDTSTEPDAQQRFREIAEAYGVLSDPAKRASYDTHGFAGLAGASAEDLWGGIDLGDIFGAAAPGFGDLFERLFGPARRPAAGRRPARRPGRLAAAGADRRETDGLDSPAGPLPGLRRQRPGGPARHGHRPHPARHPGRNRAAAGRTGHAQPRARRPAG